MHMAVPEIAELGWLPEQAQEDALHADRLLNVEERALQRVTKALLGADSILRPSMTHLLTPPPDGELGYDATKATRFRESVLLDFANLENSIVRIQLILSSNQRERERYAAEKAKIEETAEAVKANTKELHEQLKEAQELLKLRKGYDVHAAKILDDKTVKSRHETTADIEKLERDIEDLQAESAEYESTWATRRLHFDSVVREGDAMVRVIRGIKDEPEAEPEKDETMEDVDDAAKGEMSRDSPAPDERSPRPMDVGDATPLPESGEAGGSTPRPANKFLDVEDATRSNSRASSPMLQPNQSQDDVDMGESAGLDGNESESRPKTSDSTEATASQAATPLVSTPAADAAMDET